MKEGLFTEDMEQLDIVKENYLKLLTEDGYNGDEIFLVYGFLRDILSDFQRGNKRLLSDHMACVESIIEDYESNKKLALSQYDSQVSQRKEQARAGIEEKRKEIEEKSNASNERLNKTLEHGEEIRNTQLSKLDEERKALLQKFQNVKKPDDHHFFIKSKKKEYAAKYEEYRKLYDTLQEEIDSKERVLKEKLETGIGKAKKKNLKELGKYKAAFEAFKTEEKSAMEIDIKKYEEQKRQRLEELEEEKNRKTEEEDRHYSEWLGQNRERLLDACRGFLTACELLGRIQEEKERRFNFGSFQGMEKMPVYLDQGYLSCQLDPDLTEGIPKEIMDTIWEWVGEFNCAKEPYVIKLPNVQKAYPGISYFLAMDTGEHMDVVRTLVLSILMQYPAGSMDLVVVNPEGSGCFTGLETLGREGRGVADVQMWDTDYDIEAGFSALEGELGRMAGQYGKAVGRCLEKEKRILVAIADFPRGFSENSQERLIALLENGPGYGISFVVAQNNKEMEAEKDSSGFGQRLKSMAKMMRILTSEDGRICYQAVYNDQEYVWNHIMDTGAILDDDGHMTREICRRLSEKSYSGDQ